MTTPPPATPDPRVWGPDLAARLRAMLHVAPLVELRARDRQVDPAMRHYDSMALAVRLIDLVVASTGLEDELDHDGAVAALRPLLAAMDVGAGVPPDPGRHEAAARRLLALLLNDEEGREPFGRAYLDVEGTAATERHLSFRLLSDYHAAGPGGGRIVLRLSTEALNLYLRALDLDLADAQAANEALVQSQLARGRFEDAYRSARNARLQSIHYARALDEQLERTRRDVRRVDWAEAVPRMLADAYEHLRLRLSTEENIREAAEEKLDALAPGSDGARHVAAVAELMRDCHHRHTQLHHRLMGARAVFLDAQAQQAFAPTRALVRPDVGRAVLEPLLRARVVDARRGADAALRVLRPASAPGLLLLSQTILWQLRPRREVPLGAVARHAVEPEHVGDDLRAFPDEVREEAAGMIRQAPSGSALSAMLQQGAADGRRGAVLSALTLYVLRAFAPDPRTRTGEPAPRTATDFVVERIPGVALAVPGYTGDDLCIGTPTAGAPS